MKMTVSVAVNLKEQEVIGKVTQASKLAMRDTVVEVTHDAVKGSPWLTGNNRRSITGEASGMGMVASGGEGASERMIDDSKIEGAVYSTSGYGGYIEIGTDKMDPRPYFKPAMDKNFTRDKYAQKVRSHLGGR